MTDQPAILEESYQRRIYAMALIHLESVVLQTKNTSGKTLTLFVKAGGASAKPVVRLHRKEHKKFWRIVRAAQDWLAGLKIVCALSKVGKVLVREAKNLTARKLAKAVSAISEQPKVAAAARKYTGGKKANTTLANQYYHPERNVIDLSIKALLADLNAERGVL